MLDIDSINAMLPAFRQEEARVETVIEDDEGNIIYYEVGPIGVNLVTREVFWSYTKILRQLNYLLPSSLKLSVDDTLNIGGIPLSLKTPFTEREYELIEAVNDYLPIGYRFVFYDKGVIPVRRGKKLLPFDRFRIEEVGEGKIVTKDTYLGKYPEDIEKINRQIPSIVRLSYEED